MTTPAPAQKPPRTVLGKAMRRIAERQPDSQQPKETERTNSLRDVILGGQDGLVNMLGIALGVVSAGGSTDILIATGLAAAITESISMGAVAYTSFGSDRDFYAAQRRSESEAVSSDPEEERAEIRQIYADKGFDGPLLDEVVEKITSNRETWVDTMMNEELHLEPVKAQAIWRSAVIVTVATLIGHMIPLSPFLVLPRGVAVWLAVALSGLVLFGVGAYSALTLVGDWRKSGVQMVAIGLGAAALGFLIGRLFHAAG